jgi:hypothetical protein
MFSKDKSMTASEMGRLGAIKTNAMRTPEGRSAAAKKGWRMRKQKLKEEKEK